MRFESEGTDNRVSMLSFPTDKPFYPMRATSGYGKQRMDVNLYVAGLVKPT